MSSLSTKLFGACVKVHDELVGAAQRNALTGQQGDLLETMMGFIRSAPAIESFEEILMATAYDVAVVQGRRSIVVDLALARKISRGHADRKIKRGRVLLAFQRAGKALLLPSGRKIEMLAELPEDHWIPCWEFVVSRAEKKGKVSDRDAEIQMKIWEFQHRKDTPSTKLMPPEPHAVDLTDLATESVAEVQADESRKEPKPTPQNISPDLASRFYSFLCPRSRGALASSLRRGDPIRTALGVLLRLAGKKQPGNAATIDEFFNDLGATNPDLLQCLERKGRMLLLRECSAMVEQYANQLGKAAKHYHSRKATPPAWK